MVDLKELGEGVSLGGGYTLEHWVRHDGTGTFFTVLTEDGERLLIKLVPERSPEAEQQFATWQRSRHLRHAHLLELRDVGHSELGGNGYFYGVFEYPDDVLAAALKLGPLSEPETRGVLEAALAALRYLHGQGLVHGAVDPDHIVAVGETVKLTTDALRESDDLDGHPEDVRQLGELVRSLRAPEPLSEPLTTVVQHATVPDKRQRWTLAEIARVIDPPPAITPPAVTAPVPPMPVPVPPTAPPPPVHRPLPAAAVSVRPGEADARSPKAFPKWIFAGVAILLLSILVFNLRRKPVAQPVAVTVPPAVQSAAPAPPAVAPIAPTPVNTPPPAPSAGIWRVIAFTYRSRDMAAKKAQQINNRWPELRASVFAPKEVRGYYLVALGDGMNREEATRLQHKAHSLGLPRDTYVQNYRE
jgi:eukaryotic-like serine/threonine-protein kinase